MVYFLWTSQNGKSDLLSVDGDIIIFRAGKEYYQVKVGTQVIITQRKRALCLNDWHSLDINFSFTCLISRNNNILIKVRPDHFALAVL